MIHFSEHRHFPCLQLDRACRDPRVVGVLVPLFHDPFDREAHFFRDAVQEGRVPHNHLQDPVHVPQIDKGHAAVVADILHPARHLQRLPNMLFTDLFHRNVSVHLKSSFFDESSREEPSSTARARPVRRLSGIFPLHGSCNQAGKNHLPLLVRRASVSSC